MFELTKLQTLAFKETSLQSLSQTFPLIFLPEEPVQWYHFLIIIQQITLKNFPITRSSIKQTHLIRWFAAVVVLC